MHSTHPFCCAGCVWLMPFPPHLFWKTLTHHEWLSEPDFCALCLCWPSTPCYHSPSCSSLSQRGWWCIKGHFDEEVPLKGFKVLGVFWISLCSMLHHVMLVVEQLEPWCLSLFWSPIFMWRVRIFLVSKCGLFLAWLWIYGETWTFI